MKKIFFKIILLLVGLLVQGEILRADIISSQDMIEITDGSNHGSGGC